jgi:hypothetical protein
MLASQREIVHLDIREIAGGLIDFLPSDCEDPVPPNSEGLVALDLTGHRTGLTA